MSDKDQEIDQLIRELMRHLFDLLKGIGLLIFLVLLLLCYEGITKL